MSVLYDALKAAQDDRGALVLSGDTESNNHRNKPALRQIAPPPGDDWDFDMLGAGRILLRRRRWIYCCTAFLLLAAATVCIVMTPQYRAESTLEILKQDMGGVSLTGAVNPAAGGLSDALDLNLTMQTQMAVLRSDTLALQVIKELHLVDDKEFSYNPLIKTAAVRRAMAAPIEQSAAKRAAVIKKFKAHLTVESVSGARLITVSYTHPNPVTTANIVNQLIADFVEYNFQVRHNAITRATQWLSQELVEMKSQVERSEGQAVRLQKESGIFGQDEQHNIVVTRLEQLNNEVTATEATRVVKEAVYNLARNGNPELVAGLVGTPNTRTGSENNTLPLLNNLRQQEAELNAQCADAAAKYGADHPKLIQMKQRLAALRTSIDEEMLKVVGTAKSEYELALSHESAAKKSFSEQKKIASEMNAKAIDFQLAKHEADSSRSLYEQLLQKLKEADVLAGLRSSELHVVDAALVPSRPARPNVPLYLAFGALAGAVLGVVCAFIVDNMDGTVRNPDEIETATRLPVFGVIPEAGSLVAKSQERRFKVHPWKSLTGKVENAGSVENGALILDAGNSPIAEAFRSVRTSLLAAPGNVFMVTSAGMKEGKSFSAFNLAVTLVQNGGKVLLVDADLRRGGSLNALVQGYRKNSFFNGRDGGASQTASTSRDDGTFATGLSQVLLGETGREAYKQVDAIPGLTFLPAGNRPPNPSELLGSRRMTMLVDSWRREFTYVVIDTPPVLPVTDAVVLAPNVDVAIVVVRFAVSSQRSIVRTIRMLRDVNTECLGVVVNAMDVRSPDYYHYSGSTYAYDGY